MEKIIVCHKQGFLSKEKTIEYEYDEKNVYYPTEAAEYIQFLMLLKADFTVSFVTEETLRLAQWGNKILAQMTGREHICGEPSVEKGAGSRKLAFVDEREPK